MYTIAKNRIFVKVRTLKVRDVFSLCDNEIVQKAFRRIRALLSPPSDYPSLSVKEEKGKYMTSSIFFPPSRTMARRSKPMATPEHWGKSVNTEG